MVLKRLYGTPIEVIELGINTCWDKHHTCRPGEPNKTKLFRVIREYKHASVSEHGRFIFRLRVEDDGDKRILNQLENNKYFNVTYNSQESYTVSTNLRAIIEIKLNNDIKKEMIPEVYHFLLEESI